MSRQGSRGQRWRGQARPEGEPRPRAAVKRFVEETSQHPHGGHSRENPTDLDAGLSNRPILPGTDMPTQDMGLSALNQKVQANQGELGTPVRVPPLSPSTM